MEFLKNASFTRVMTGTVFATQSGVEMLIKSPTFFGSEFLDKISNKN